MSIQIKEHVFESYQLFDPEGKLVGVVNYFEFLDVRAQIRQQKLEGYTLLLPE